MIGLSDAFWEHRVDGTVYDVLRTIAGVVSGCEKEVFSETGIHITFSISPAWLAGGTQGAPANGISAIAIQGVRDPDACKYPVKYKKAWRRFAQLVQGKIGASTMKPELIGTDTIVTVIDV